MKSDESFQGHQLKSVLRLEGAQTIKCLTKDGLRAPCVTLHY